MKIDTVGNGQARWMSTLTAVRETLYEVQESLTVKEIAEMIEGKESTVRSHLKMLEARGRVVRLGGRPERFIHTFWYRRGQQ